MSGFMAPPSLPGETCRFCPKTSGEQQCVSPNIKGWGEQICGYCQTLDIINLSLKVDPNDRIGWKQVEDIEKYRKKKAEDALSEGKLICVMENLEFEKEDWRGRFTPVKKHKPCNLLDAPGLHEYCLCNVCIANELDGEWWGEQVVEQRKQGGHAVVKAWIGFLCVWDDDKFAQSPWRQWVPERKHTLEHSSTSKLPNGMCDTCYKIVTRRRLLWTQLQPYFWDNGVLKSEHPDEMPMLKTT